MKINRGTALIPLACLALAACDLGKAKSAQAPKGQVVATVDGEEVTIRELRAELEGATFPDEKTRKAAEQAALQGIINRKLLAKAAREAEIDKTPDFALQKARAEEALLAQSLQKKLVADLPAPTAEEAANYVSAHPEAFAERKIFTVDQIRTPQPSDPSIMPALQPLKTLDEVEALLASKGAAIQRSTADVDAARINPKILEAISKLPPDEVFVIPENGFLLINRIINTKVAPLTGEQATKVAQNVLRQQRVQDALMRQLGDAQKAAAGKIQLGKAYQPTPAPKAAPAEKAPAPAPAQNAT